MAMYNYTDGEYESAGVCVACPSDCLDSDGIGYCGKKHKYLAAPKTIYRTCPNLPLRY